MVDGLSHTVGLFSTQLLTLWWCLQVGVDAWLHDCQCSHKTLKKVSFSRLSICRLDSPPATYRQPVSENRLALFSRLYSNIWSHSRQFCFVFWRTSLTHKKHLCFDYNQNWRLCGQIFASTGLGNAWSRLVLVKNDQKTAFRDMLLIVGGKSNQQMLNMVKLTFFRHPAWINK